MPAVIHVALAEWSPNTSDHQTSVELSQSADARTKLTPNYEFSDSDFYFVLRKDPKTGLPEFARDFYDRSDHSTTRIDEFARRTAQRLLVSTQQQQQLLPPQQQQSLSSLGRMIRVPNTYFYLFINNSTSNTSIIGLNTSNRVTLTLEQLTRMTRGASQKQTDPFERVARLRSWLKMSVSHDSGRVFMKLMFSRARSFRRICSHNPSESGSGGHVVRDVRHVTRFSYSDLTKGESPPVTLTPTGMASAQSAKYSSEEEEQDSTDLNESVKRANEARVKLIRLDKCDVFVINPLFGSRLRYDCPVQYWVESRATASAAAAGVGGVALDNRSHLSSFSSSSSSPHEDDGAARWTREYPVHHAAYTNNADRLKQLIAQGHDVNRADMDSWTPLHYAAFKDHKEAAGVLINLASADINVKTQRGVTPFHFAAQQGNALLVELLLSAPSLDIDIKDGDGRTALDLCAQVPKLDHQATAKLIKESRIARLPKVQIDLMDGSNVMVPWVQGSKTTAADLMQQVARSLNIDQSQVVLFGLWLSSESHEVQLRADMIVQNHLQKWPKQLQKYNPHEPNAWSEKPRLMFRRNVLANVSKEQSLIDIKTEAALQLLYHEAMHNYLVGHYACSEQDAITLSGLILRLVAKTSLSDSKSFLTDNAALQRIVPDHRLVGGAQQKQLIDRLHKEYQKLCKVAPKVSHEAGLRLKFMQLCWRFKTYGATFFSPCFLHLMQPINEQFDAKIGINDCGIHLINANNLVFLKSFSLPLNIQSSTTDKMALQVSSNKEQFTIMSSKSEMIQLLVKKHTEQLEQQKAGSRTSIGRRSSRAESSTSSLLKKMF